MLFLINKAEKMLQFNVEKIKQIAEDAKAIIKKGVYNALQFFELDINVYVNPVVSFKV